MKKKEAKSKPDIELSPELSSEDFYLLESKRLRRQEIEKMAKNREQINASMEENNITLEQRKAARLAQFPSDYLECNIAIPACLTLPHHFSFPEYAYTHLHQGFIQFVKDIERSGGANSITKILTTMGMECIPVKAFQAAMERLTDLETKQLIAGATQIVINENLEAVLKKWLETNATEESDAIQTAILFLKSKLGDTETIFQFLNAYSQTLHSTATMSLTSSLTPDQAPPPKLSTMTMTNIVLTAADGKEKKKSLSVISITKNLWKLNNDLDQPIYEKKPFGVGAKLVVEQHYDELSSEDKEEKHPPRFKLSIRTNHLQLAKDFFDRYCEKQINQCIAKLVSSSRLFSIDPEEKELITFIKNIATKLKSNLPLAESFLDILAQMSKEVSPSREDIFNSTNLYLVSLEINQYIANATQLLKKIPKEHSRYEEAERLLCSMEGFQPRLMWNFGDKTPEKAKEEIKLAQLIYEKLEKSYQKIQEIHQITIQPKPWFKFR